MNTFIAIAVMLCQSSYYEKDIAPGCIIQNYKTYIRKDRIDKYQDYSYRICKKAVDDLNYADCKPVIQTGCRFEIHGSPYDQYSKERCPK